MTRTAAPLRLILAPASARTRARALQGLKATHTAIWSFCAECSASLPSPGPLRVCDACRRAARNPATVGADLRSAARAGGARVWPCGLELFWQTLRHCAAPQGELGSDRDDGKRQLACRSTTIELKARATVLPRPRAQNKLSVSQARCRPRCALCAEQAGDGCRVSTTSRSRIGECSSNALPSPKHRPGAGAQASVWATRQHRSHVWCCNISAVP